MKLPMSISDLPRYSTVKVCFITTLLTVCTITAVRGNPAMSDNCVTGVQTNCAQEINELEDQQGAETCSYLSKVVSCLTCKLPNCTDVVENVIQAHSKAPFNCKLNNDDIILLQKGEKYVELCLVWKPITTEKPGNEPQVQDGGGQEEDGSGVNPVSGMRWLTIVVLSILTLLVTWQ